MSSVVVSTTALPFGISSILGDVSYVAPDVGDFARDELLRVVAHADALISLLSVPVDRELLDCAPKLKVIANYAVGFDNIDIQAANERGILVTNTPDVLTEATADFAFALLLGAARRVVAGDGLVRSGEWPGWGPGQLLGADVYGQTLGIIGFGRIGRALARRALGFSMDVVYARRESRQSSFDGDGDRFRAVSMDELLTCSDFVSLHCPLTPTTRHIIDERALSQMKSSAILVNTSRGPCIDEAALVRALDTGEIAGAALDVFEREPLVHPGLVRSDRALLAPHAGSATTTTRRRMADICARAVRAVFDSVRPTTLVNPEIFTDGIGAGPSHGGNDESAPVGGTTDDLEVNA